MSALIYDDRAPVPQGVLRDVLRYDERLRLRFNRKRQVWELWRWRQQVPIPSSPTADDFARKALKCFVIGPVLDGTLLPLLRASDMARHSPTLDPDQVHRELMRLEAEEEARQDREMERTIQDMVAQDVRQLRREIDDTYSGYYPSEL